LPSGTAQACKATRTRFDSWEEHHERRHAPLIDLEEMMRLKTGRSQACALVLGVAFARPSTSHAIPCDDVALPNKIYGAVFIEACC